MQEDIMTIQCPKGHRYNTSWSLFQGGSRCPICQGLVVTIEYVRDTLENEGYDLISKKYDGTNKPLFVGCPRGHEYQTCWNYFQQGHRCPYCAGKYKTLNDIQEYMSNEGYRLLSNVYSYHQHLDVQCPKSHRYRVLWSNYQQGYRCPMCCESKGEKLVAQILSSLGVKFVRQYRLGRGRGVPRLDFYISSLSLGIEYDGQQHYEPVRFGGMTTKQAIENFKAQQRRDKKKEGICKEKGIRLIRLKYTEEMKHIRATLRNTTQKCSNVYENRDKTG